MELIDDPIGERDTHRHAEAVVAEELASTHGDELFHGREVGDAEVGRGARSWPESSAGTTMSLHRPEAGLMVPALLHLCGLTAHGETPRA
jgi:hypothetical protein